MEIIKIDKARTLSMYSKLMNNIFTVSLMQNYAK